MALARECAGDATRFVAGLWNIQNRRKDKIDALIAYLGENGCLPLIPHPLTEERLMVELNTRLGTAAVTPEAARVEMMLTRVGMERLVEAVCA